ncbi:MAG: aminodeoxychorismate synthase component I [Chloroflexi bacterium]|nr:MAG: aminodeoxychorismate synthase component I [Chloroflexota bacterium]
MTNSVFLQVGSEWWLFRDPVRIITAVSPQDVLPALTEIETAVNQHNFYAAGYLSYEASAAFDLKTHPLTEMPLLWFGLYEEVSAVSGQLSALSPQPSVLSPQSSVLPNWQPSITQAAYDASISRIKEYIAWGHTYQVNYTMPLRTKFEDDAYAYFLDITAAQQGQYGAYLDLGSHVICSASPELFFTLDGTTIQSKPMKGTVGRGRTLIEDRQNMAWLKHSEKNRAENVMIVDMIRNDIGRVSHVGSVHVPRLFDVERYATVLQMTSTVAAMTDASFAEIMAHMFPCASITGAPKVRTMEIINELEPHPRGIYTGSIGYLAPGRKAQFNVAIRTVVIDRETDAAVYGVGGGIVWDSEAGDEYEECRVKARVLTEKRPSFDLLDALLWEPENGYFLLEHHMNRLLSSAEYFNVPIVPDQLEMLLTEFAATLSEPAKVRVQLKLNGVASIEAVPLAAGDKPEPVRVGLAKEPVDANSIWLYHKTTRRQVYTNALASRPDCDDVLLWNERGELTETSSSNIVLKLEEELVTPPISSGLLSGTLRESLLQNGRITERILTLDDLKRCEQIYLINSVRKWKTAVLVE